MSVLGTLAILGIGYALWRYGQTGKTLQKLRFSVVGAEIRNARLFVNIRAYNPTTNTVNVTGSRITVFYGSEPVGYIEITDRVIITPGSVVLSVPVRINALSAFKVLLNKIKSSEKVSLLVKGYINTTAGKYNINENVEV